MHRLVIRIDCSELSGEMKLALAEAISEGLDGRGVALLSGGSIAIDLLRGPEVTPTFLESLAQSYLSKRKDASAYRVEVNGESVIVHSLIPVSAQEKKVQDKLPPGLHQCPVCGFVTASEGEYENHLRIHDILRGIR